MGKKQSQGNAETVTITGQSGFVVRITAAGISVQTALMIDNKQVIENVPAVFPDADYAFSQIDELRKLVSQHFSKAAQIGGQLLEQQADLPSDDTLIH